MSECGSEELAVDFGVMVSWIADKTIHGWLGSVTGY